MKATIVLWFLFGFLACDKAQADDPLCISNDPLEEIDWLKDIKEMLEQRANPTGGQIIQFTYQGACVFWVDTCYGCADNLIRVYDAEMNVVCEFGGIAGFNTCPDFERAATDQKMLFDATG
jgi:hypothetical protein